MNVVDDNSWIKQSFLLPLNATDDAYSAALRVYSSVRGKYTDTTMGGNWPINGLPGFTKYADPPRRGSYAGSEGMGPFYSEVIDDNAVLVHMRMGVPKYNSLTRFFGNFYSIEAASLARTGRGPYDVFFAAGEAIGTVLALPLAPVVLVGKVFRFFIDYPSSRYYYMKDTMHTYWAAVSNMVNGIVAAEGWHPSMFTSSRGLQVDDGAYDPKADSWDRINQLLPEIFDSSGYIDVYKMSMKAQALALAFKNQLESKLSGDITYQRRAELIMQIADRDNKLINMTGQDVGEYQTSLAYYLEAYSNTLDGSYDRNEAVRQSVDVTPNTREEYDKALQGYGNFFSAARHEANQWVTFRVDNMGTQSESFSSQTKTSGIADSINSLSSNARDARFNVADGNVDGAGVVKSVVDAAAAVAQGIGKAFSVEGIAALAGSAFADIPEQWDSSSADINRITFNIPLRAPYNHPISKLQNITIPLCAILATGLPLSAGPQSYTHPFLVQVFCRGRAHVRMGIVESIQVTRGVGDVGWSKSGDYLGVDVSVTIKDLSSVLHMPISTQADRSRLARFAQAGAGLIGGEAAASAMAALDSSVYNSDSLYDDYIATMASIPLEDETSKLAKWTIRRRQAAMRSMQMSSPAYIASWTMSTLPGEILRAVSTRTDRDRYDELNRVGGGTGR